MFRQSASLYHQIGGLSVRKYIIKRILISIVILFFVAFVIYALMRCLPTSYVEASATSGFGLPSASTRALRARMAASVMVSHPLP